LSSYLWATNGRRMAHTSRSLGGCAISTFSMCNLWDLLPFRGTFISVPLACTRCPWWWGELWQQVGTQQTPLYPEHEVA
jgi:hypothetical protein